MHAVVSLLCTAVTIMSPGPAIKAPSKLAYAFDEATESLWKNSKKS